MACDLIITTLTMDNMIAKYFAATTTKLNATSDPSPVKGSTGRGNILENMVVCLFVVVVYL